MLAVRFILLTLIEFQKSIYMYKTLSLLQFNLQSYQIVNSYIYHSMFILCIVPSWIHYYFFSISQIDNYLCRKWAHKHSKACWFARNRSKKRSQGRPSKPRNAHDATPPTPSFATTTITASPNQGSSANPAEDTGQKVGLWEMFRWEEGAGRPKGRHHPHLHHRQSEARIIIINQWQQCPAPVFLVSTQDCLMIPMITFHQCRRGIRVWV